MGAVILVAKDNSLSIEVTEESTGIANKGWTYFHLVGQETVFLGANMASSLVHLRDWLHEDGLSNWQIVCNFDGVPVAQLFMLWEKHHVLFAGVDGPDRLLFWNNAGVHHPADELMATGTSLDSDATRPIPMTGIMRLSPEHREQWVEALTAILETDTA